MEEIRCIKEETGVKLDPLSALCRICFENNGFRPFFKLNAEEGYGVYCEMILQCFNIQITPESHNLNNNNICESCVNRLLDSYKLKSQILNSQKVFQTHLNTIDVPIEQDESDKISINDEYHFDVKSNKSDELLDNSDAKDSNLNNESSDPESGPVVSEPIGPKKYDTISLDKKQILVKCYKEGNTMVKAAKIAGIKLNTAKAIIRRFYKNGEILVNGKRNVSRPSKLTSELSCEIERIIKENPMITLRSIREYILEHKHEYESKITESGSEKSLFNENV